MGRFLEGIQPGDPIGIAYSNHIALGIYVGLGSVGNINYFFPKRVLYAKSKGQVPYKSYINRHESVDSQNGVRIYLRDLNKSDQDEMIEAINYLKEKGVL